MRMLLFMLSLVLLTACERDDPMQRIKESCQREFGAQGQVRSIIECAGLSRRRYHDNDVAVASATIFAAPSSAFRIASAKIACRPGTGRGSEHRHFPFPQ